MPKYLVQFRYSPEGSKGALKEGGTKRRAAVKKAVESTGGTLDCFYYSFGEFDGVLIADMPDAASVAALSLAVSATGAASNRTTVLLAPSEIDAAARKKLDYRRPGK